MAYNKKIKHALNTLADILPKNYSKETLLSYFKEYFPFEWKELVEMQELHKAKDDFLNSVGKKTRYKPLEPHIYFYSLPKVKQLTCEKQRNEYNKNFDDSSALLKRSHFRQNRLARIERREQKINDSFNSIQKIDPYHTDISISIYHMKGTTHFEKIEIVKELSKFYSNKIITFFYKLNDAENNYQIKNFAFSYLQKCGRYVRLRGKQKGKKKEYNTKTDDFFVTPEILAQRISKNTIQKHKKYNYFISHSYLDNEKILEIIKKINSLGKICYCDWLSDNDFLKRELAGEYTFEVLKARISQSDRILLATSKNSINSMWVKKEIEFAKSIGKNIVSIDLEFLDEDNMLELLKEHCSL